MKPVKQIIAAFSMWLLLIGVFSGSAIAAGTQNTAAQARGWECSNDNWYFYGQNGSKTTGWQHLWDQWYWFDGQGRMQTGWKQISGTWYYFKPNGVMAANEWINGYWLNADGSWTYPYIGSWYQNSYGRWYADSTGWYERNSTVKIDGVLYQFNSAGYLTGSPAQDTMYYLAIGNEITKSQVSDTWWQPCGMAASESSKDYVHLIANSLRTTLQRPVEMDAVNLSEWESQYWDRSETLEILEPYLRKQPALITIQLGEHAEDLTTYEQDYQDMIRYLKACAPNARILVIQDFWTDNGVRQDIECAVVQSTEAEFVSLSDIAGKAAYQCGIGTTVYDTGRKAHSVQDADVAKHPGDTGMRAIAGHVLQVFGEWQPKITIRAGWVYQDGSWFYYNTSGKAQTSWQQIDGVWYYFKSNGVMAANEWINGYWLNADGSWTYPYIGSWKKNAIGWWYGDTAGWYARSCTIRIDGVDYRFNAAGYWETAPKSGSFQYLAIGNSITAHGITSSWWQVCGMAASDLSKDYVHVTARALENVMQQPVETSIINLSEWETRYENRSGTLSKLDSYLSKQPNLVTIQLGENAQELSTYEQDYINLISYVRAKAPNARILVVQDFWTGNDARQNAERNATWRTGAEFVSLDGIAGNSAYCAGMGTTVYDAYGRAYYINHDGVAAHPGDLGMQAISDSIMRTFIG